MDGRALLEAFAEPDGTPVFKRWIVHWDGQFWLCYDRDDDSFLGIRAIRADKPSPRRRPRVTARRAWGSWAA